MPPLTITGQLTELGVGEFEGRQHSGIAVSNFQSDATGDMVSLARTPPIFRAFLER